jgi:hypothetical protein
MEASRMRQIPAVIVLIIVFVPPYLAAATINEVPRFDVANTCREARAYAGNDKEVAFRGCMKDENDAREQLVQKWTHFKAADRSDCIAQGAAPMPSYVEILTCLEMSEEAAALNKPGRVRPGKLQGKDLQRKPGQDQAAPSGNRPAPLAPLPEAGGATSGPD